MLIRRHKGREGRIGNTRAVVTYRQASPDGHFGSTLLLRNLQALRAYAALSVAGFHFALTPAASLPWHFGSFGVDLFFVLSGFIVAHATKRDHHHFLIHRAIRVLPSYWLVTSMGLLLVLLAMPARIALGWYGQSLLFITSPEGRPPIIFVGWTLVYELIFYLTYATILRIDTARAPLLAIPVLLVMAYSVHAVGFAARTWPLLVEFTYGLAVFLVTERLGTRQSPPVWAVLLVVMGLVALYALEGLTHGRDGSVADLTRIVALGLPSAAVVLGLVLLEQAGCAVRSSFVLTVGAASYAIYLLHPLVFSFALPFAAGSFGLRLTIFATLMAATIAISLPFHALIEAPLVRLLRRRIGRSPEAARGTVLPGS